MHTVCNVRVAGRSVGGQCTCTWGDGGYGRWPPLPKKTTSKSTFETCFKCSTLVGPVRVLLGSNGVGNLVSSVQILCDSILFVIHELISNISNNNNNNRRQY